MIQKFIITNDNRLIEPLRVIRKETLQEWGREKAQAFMNRIGRLGANTILEAQGHPYILGREPIDVEFEMIDPNAPVKKKRGRPKGSKNKPKQLE